MASPYTSVSVSGYNSNPPADDGSQVASNQILWSTIKTKLPDPIKTAVESINSNIVTAFAKVVGGAGVTSSGVDYTVQSSDQGKLVRATASGITITTPDASTVTSPFVFAILNNSSGSITFDGNGSQTVDGNANLAVSSGTGFLVYTDGTNWFTTGRQGVLTGAQLRYGDIINGTITESNGSNAVTFSVKTLAGNDPSATDPVLVAFRNSTAGNGNYVYRTITSALSLTVSSGSTLGTSNGVPCRLWLVIFDDGGTLRLGVINCKSGSNIYPLGQSPRVSSTAEGGAGAADSAHVFYTGTAVTTKAYTILGYVDYLSGLATAGSWNVSPDTIQLFGDGIPLPGAVVQSRTTTTTTTTAINSTTKAATSLADTITRVSAANIVKASAYGQVERTAASSANCSFISQLYRASGATAIGNMTTAYSPGGATRYPTVNFAFDDPQSTTAAVQYALYVLLSTGTDTWTFLGTSNSVGANTGVLLLEEIQS